MEEIPNRLIVDACILFSFFKASSARREILKRLIDRKCELFSPDFALTELSNNKKDIMRFSKINDLQFDEVLRELNESITTINQEVYKSMLNKAEKIAPHQKDAPYFALACSLNCPIWSDEEAFRKQNNVGVFTTNKLDILLRNEGLLKNDR